jgi:hypothetical protein
MNRSEAARRAQERRRDRDDLLEHEIDEELVVVWRAIGPRARSAFRATAYRSRAETFAEWCHDHAGDVARIAIAAQEAGIDALIATERDAYDARQSETASDVDLTRALAHLAPTIAARLAARAPGSCLARWGRRPAHRKECPGCRAALPVPF